MSEPTRDGEPQKQRKEYTLPGIMQYLQSQFTLAERNRMQSDLERSSLKLKIVELESERNALKLKNEKLNLQVEKLQEKLSKYESNGNSELSRSSSGKLLRSISIGRKHEKESTEKKNDLNDLAEINTIDLKKLLEARKFLKSATSEIMYLLKSPNVVMEDPLQLDKRSFFNNANPNIEIGSPTTNGDSLLNSPQNEDYLDMEIPLDRSSLRTKNHAQFKDEAPTSDTETNTIIGEEIGNSGKVHTIKPFKVMKRDKNDATLNLAHGKRLGMSVTPNYGKLIRGKLYCFDKNANKVQCYVDIENQPENCVVDRIYSCPEDFVDLVDVNANSDYLVVAGKAEVLVFLINSSKKDSKPIFTFKGVSDNLKSIDINETDDVLLAFNNTVQILKISKQNTSFTSVHSSNYKNKGELLCARFTAFGKQLGFAVLTTAALVLESIDSVDAVKENDSLSWKSQTINLSSFDHYMLTSKNLAINLEQGLFMIEFTNLTAFNHVPLLTPLDQDGYLGCADDNGSLFYSHGSPNVLEVFQVISTGDILSLKTITLRDAGLLWCTIGSDGNGLVICIADKNGVSIDAL